MADAAFTLDDIINNEFPEEMTEADSGFDLTSDQIGRINSVTRARPEVGDAILPSNCNIVLP